MNQRSWPWKKKSSYKVLSTTDLVTLSTSAGLQTEQGDAETEKYMQIAVESYAQFSGMEDHMKTLNEKLLATQTEMTIKDNLVKQHAKVAEEAVSGWEQVETEALALKQQLESVTLLKASAEERASHLDGAIKECMKQLRNVKEESEIKLHDVIFTKTRQWENEKADLEAKLFYFEQELLKASSDNSTLSRYLQERSSLLMKACEEKSQAEAQIEVLKNNIQSCERELSCMKYELHVVNKEAEIRNEEKNMSLRSAEVINKQHLEDVKKITKLEAECQKLRGLVRKKLPGPAALAQMKFEVENLGRASGDNRLRRSPSKEHHATSSDLTIENIQQVQKDNDFLTERLLAMEEEMKMLKEALSNRNSELQVSRKMGAKQANRLRNMEDQAVVFNQNKIHSKFRTDAHFENESNPPSLTSMSEDAIDEEMSYSDSSAAALIKEISYCKKEKDVDKDSKAENSHYLEFMDDFFEMEQLACLSTDASKDINISDGVKAEKNDVLSMDNSLNITDTDEQKITNLESVLHASKESPLEKLKSRIISTFDFHAPENIIEKVLEDLDHIFQDFRKEFLPQYFAREGNNEFTGDNYKQSFCLHNSCETIDVEISSRNSCSPRAEFNNPSDQSLKNAITYIHRFLVSLCKENAEIQDNNSTGFFGKRKKVEELSAYMDRTISNKISLHDFILDLTHIMSETCNLRFMLTSKGKEGENNCSDFIDKETLLENKVAPREQMNNSLPGVSLLAMNSSSLSEEAEESLGSVFGVKTALPSFTWEEFESLKLEKEKSEVDLTKCEEMLNQTKAILVEVEQQLSELKSELASCQNTNILAETQLKCMAESYKILEFQKDKLEAEISGWRAKAETLDNELQLERLVHQEDLVKYNELQEKIDRNRNCSTKIIPPDTDITKSKQEIEIAAAAQKLAECQETIILLGRQLHTMKNPANQMDSSPNNGSQLVNDLKYEENGSCLKPLGLFSPLRSDHTVQEYLINSKAEKSSRESPLNGYSPNMCSSETEQTHFRKSPMASMYQKSKVCTSSSSSSHSNAIPEKHGRGLRKLFSKKKIEY